MFQQWFDDLARAAAGGRSRRQALKQFGGVVGAAVVAALPGQVLADPGGNSACAHFCHQVFAGEAAGDCTSQAAHGTGPCYTCGPAAPAGHPDLCGQVCCPAGTPNCCPGNTCVSLASDVHHCGACGKVCTAPANGAPVCTGGVCDFVCNQGYSRCGNTCVNEQTDVQNCGSCGKVCTAPPNGTPVCNSGACGFTCNSGFKLCNGACIPTSACCTAADCPAGPANSTPTCTGGACGFTCNSGFKLCNGACIPTSACCTAADCPAGPANSTPTCSGGACGFTCNPGFTLCNGACVNEQTDVNHCGACTKVCTAPANATATCTGGICGFTCTTGYKLCNGACIPNASCCTAADCPTPANGAATCTGGACGITCDSGYQACNGACIPTSVCCKSTECGAGKVCVHGGCFQVTSTYLTCPGCNTGCRCGGSIQGTGQYVCDALTSTHCTSNADCPYGQACQEGLHICVKPC